MDEVSPIDWPSPLASVIPAEVDHLLGGGGVDTAVSVDTTAGVHRHLLFLLLHPLGPGVSVTSGGNVGHFGSL